MNGQRRGGLLLAVATAVVSGVAVFVNGYGVRAVRDAAVYTTGKNAVSAIRRAPLTRPVGVRQSLGLVVVGVVGGSVPFVLFFEGLSQESSTDAAFLQKTLVLWVALLAVPLLHERLGWLQAAAVGLLLVGQAMAGGSVSAVVHMPLGRGEAMILGATLLWAVEVVVARRPVYRSETGAPCTGTGSAPGCPGVRLPGCTAGRPARWRRSTRCRSPHRRRCWLSTPIVGARSARPPG